MLTLLLAPRPGMSGSNPPTPGLMERYETVVDMYLTERFEEALELAKGLRRDYPDDPAGAFGLISTYQAIQWNYRVRKYEADVDSLIDLCFDLAEAAIERDKNDARGHFYMGCALGFRMLKSVSLRKWISAFRDATQLPKSFKRTLHLDPDFYDAYYGLGLYRYWLGAKGAMRYLPGAGSNRTEGIEQMKLTAEKGRFLKVNALYGLVAVYHNEKDYQAALEVTEELSQLFPVNPNLQYRRGRLFQALGNWRRAASSFEQLDKLLMTAPYKSYSYRVDALFQTARSYHELGDLTKAQLLCQEAIALLDRCDSDKELDGPLDKFKEIEKSLLELDSRVGKELLASAQQK